MSNSQTEVKTASTTSVSTDVIKTPTKELSIIKNNVRVEATLKGEGTLVIGGDFKGNIKIDDTLFLEDGTRCAGRVQVKNIKVSGELFGDINAVAVEVTKTGKVDTDEAKSKRIKIEGKVKGRVVASELLEVISTGANHY